MDSIVDPAPDDDVIKSLTDKLNLNKQEINHHQQNNVINTDPYYLEDTWR